MKTSEKLNGQKGSRWYYLQINMLLRTFFVKLVLLVTIIKNIMLFFSVKLFYLQKNDYGKWTTMVILVSKQTTVEIFIKLHDAVLIPWFWLWKCMHMIESCKKHHKHLCNDFKQILYNLHTYCTSWKAYCKVIQVFLPTDCTSHCLKKAYKVFQVCPPLRKFINYL